MLTDIYHAKQTMGEATPQEVVHCSKQKESAKNVWKRLLTNQRL